MVILSLSLFFFFFYPIHPLTPRTIHNPYFQALTVFPLTAIPIIPNSELRAYFCLWMQGVEKFTIHFFSHLSPLLLSLNPNVTYSVGLPLKEPMRSRQLRERMYRSYAECFLSYPEAAVLLALHCRVEGMGRCFPSCNYSKSPTYKWILFWECICKSSLFLSPATIA